MVCLFIYLFICSQLVAALTQFSLKVQQSCSYNAIWAYKIKMAFSNFKSLPVCSYVLYKNSYYRKGPEACAMNWISEDSAAFSAGHSGSLLVTVVL